MTSDEQKLTECMRLWPPDERINTSEDFKKVIEHPHTGANEKKDLLTALHAMFASHATDNFSERKTFLDSLAKIVAILPRRNQYSNRTQTAELAQQALQNVQDKILTRNLIRLSLGRAKQGLVFEDDKPMLTQIQDAFRQVP